MEKWLHQEDIKLEKQILDKQVLIFGGTSEGRKLAEILNSNNIKCTICVATEYGETLLPKSENISVICGRMDCNEITRLLKENSYSKDNGYSQNNSYSKENGYSKEDNYSQSNEYSKENVYSQKNTYSKENNYSQKNTYSKENKYSQKNIYSFVIDATHPYAYEISVNVKTSCIKTNTKYLRLLRGKTDKDLYSGKVKLFENTRQAAVYLSKMEGRILLTTGSKELAVFCQEIEDKSRITARVLPSANAIEACNNAGLLGKQIIAMHGPFSKELNVAIIKQAGVRFLVTKESGNAGGFLEKIYAAEETGTEVILIKRPVEEDGYTLEEILNILGIGNINNSISCGEISLIGMGMGNSGTFTIDGIKALEKAELIIGSLRLIETVKAVAGAVINISGKEIYNAYNADIIYSYIKEHSQYTNIAILLSGDTGFYSGAKHINETLQELNGYNITIIPGISSVAYFAAKLKINWQNIKLVSLHGRNQNIIAAIKNNEKTFVLLGTGNSVAWLALLCIQYGLNHVLLHIGQNLGYDSEEIISGTPASFTEFINKGSLYCAIIENPAASKNIITHGIPDSQFIRGNVPMTKEEIREISVSKLHLVRDAIVYDIGAGTGSVAVECAKTAYNGKVYAIEQNKEAAGLIEQNKLLHGAFNLNIINGTAPDAIYGLEPPTHVFIGGSSGKLKQIINIIFNKNSNVRIVINAITIETIAEVQEIIKEKGLNGADITCVTASKAKEAGNYHIMTGLNPVWIIVLENTGKEW